MAKKSVSAGDGIKPGAKVGTKAKLKSPSSSKQASHGAAGNTTANRNGRSARKTLSLKQQLAQREAEFQIINSIQQGLAAELDFQAIVDLVGDKLREVINIGEVSIHWYDEKANLIHYLYAYEHGKRLTISPTPPNFIFEFQVRTHEPFVANTLEEKEKFGMTEIPGTERSKSYISVPFFGSEGFLGDIAVENYEHENAFGESEIRLLTTIAVSLGTALENARLFDETQRLLKETEERNAELAVINSVQQALAAQLDMQGIYDAVGDKIRDIFEAQGVIIGTLDYDSRRGVFNYFHEKGQRFYPDPVPFSGLMEHIVETGEMIVINHDMEERVREYRMTVAAGELAKSGIWMPFKAGNVVRGIIALQNIDRENAFSDSDVRLLQTLSNSMSVALENARLFDETQRLLKETEQRNAELAIINSVQQGLASKLDFQSIIDLVGDKIREIFDAESINIAHYDKQVDLFSSLYTFERGIRSTYEPTSPGPIFRRIVETGESLLFRALEELNSFGAITIPGTVPTKSGIYVPLVQGRDLLGIIALENADHENAFSEADLSLLTTLANSMSVALENARLFDETQRLLKETEQRAAELAIINSVQEGLASNLKIQAIYDLLGDKIREVFDAQVVTIVTFDHEKQLSILNYGIEKGRRFFSDPYPLTAGHHNLMGTRTPIFINQNWEEQMREYGFTISIAPGTETPKSSVIVPLIVEQTVKGSVSLQNVDRENAFRDSDVRLLQTLANSMSVALENAHLFNETQRLLKETEERNAELAVINSVQQGLASKLEFQSIIDLVGDKVTEIFNAQATLISLYDPERSEIDHRYLIERGQRILFDRPVAVDKFRQRVVETRQPWLINQDYQKITVDIGEEPILEGEEPKSLLFVPMIVGNTVTGIISIQNLDVENAFSQSDMRLLSTIAASMSVALENARLFEETQRLLKETERRAAELSAISTISQALVAETDLKAMIQLIGSQTRDTFNADIAYVALLDPQTNLIRFPYQHGEDFTTLSLGEGLTSKILESGEPLLINKDIAERRAELGTTLVGREALSYLGVPIKAGKETIGVLSVQSVTEEGVFDDDDRRLLTTIAANAGAAIHTARLHAEMQRRAREMATLAEVGRDISASLDVETVLKGITTHAKDLLNANTSALFLPEADGRTFRAIAVVGEIAEELRDDTIALGEGILGNIALQKRGEIVNDTNADPRGLKIVGTDDVQDEHLMAVPLLANDELKGLMSIWRTGKGQEFTDFEL